ncbi:hypothetical protein F4777DRAFT_151729 [Nemania sp. FL0916]|nr:hypothetical protein F4777DRAFT_151729 [Nemania sp. FL0916]
MRLRTFITHIILLSAVPSAVSIPPLQPLPPLPRPSSAHRIDVSTCEYYGYVDAQGVYNEYTIELAGWGNDMTSTNCADRVPNYITSQCRSGLVDFTCTKGTDTTSDTQVSFRINKAAIFQPDCVTEGLRLASRARNNEQTIQCFCLAECWPSQTTI